MRVLFELVEQHIDVSHPLDPRRVTHADELAQQARLTAASNPATTASHIPTITERE
jgi:hypothetical protein